MTQPPARGGPPGGNGGARSGAAAPDGARSAGPTTTHATGDMAALFRSAGDVGRDLDAVDWTATPLGEPSSWPQSLQTAVSMLVSSRFSMWMAWGPELTFFCNAAYRRDTLGAKYPWALGRPASEVWAEIWPDIGPRIARVMSTGEATWDEALLLFLERAGYREETYHTFSYSPLRDDDGLVAGMLCVVTEDTERVIASRRMATLRDLGSGPTALRSEPEILEAACRHLEQNRRDFPFAALYLFEADGAGARLAGACGLPPGHPAAPELLSADDPSTPWLAAVPPAGGGSAVVELGGWFADLPTGDWAEPPTRALVVPLVQQGAAASYGFLVAALNRYRPFDTDYRSFVELAAGQIAADLGGARAYQQERRRAEALAELDAAKTAFFTNVSHELRTPLTLMLGPTEDALADAAEPLSPGQRHRVELVLRNQQRLLKLVNTLLDFSRIEARRAVGQYEPTDLARYTGELASMFHSAAVDVGLDFTVDTPPLPEPAYVDREMWAKIVLNLLSNALKFTFSGGIAIRLAAADGAVELSVSDTGVGIDPAEQGRLFQRFHRVAGARSRTHEGTGIGLALVAELAALHGGSVGLESRPGRGSTFTVRIPLGSGHLPPEQLASGGSPRSASVPATARGYLAEVRRWSEPAGAEPDAAEQPVAADDGRPLVLVVDDNPDMRDYVTGLLSRDFRVATAVDGMDALARARVQPPDLVLTDVMMPRLDGFGLLAALRAEPATAEIPVVMLSARAGEEGVVEGLRAGADDYLGKPFGAQELLARVRTNVELDRARRARDRLHRSQELLDQAQRLAQVGSWEVDLATGVVSGSPNLLRLLGTDAEELAAVPYPAAVDRRVHPDDRDRVVALLAAAESGAPVGYETRVLVGGRVRTVAVRGELVRDEAGRPARLRGSLQDVTDQRETEQRLAAAAAAREASARESRIAAELQASLLPERVLTPDHLQVATYYRAGVEGTHVGGDWYDVIELGAGRAALVIGDVMGRGVRAAAVMGQLRSAVRAYARLDLRPGHLLELCDGIVRDLGDDHIVTCVYLVYDPLDGTLTYANAGHLPPLLAVPGATPRPLSGAGGPPLGAGPATVTEQRIPLPPGSLVALYTDGLVERRGHSLDEGLAAFAAGLAAATGPLHDRLRPLVEALLPGGPSDDVAVLLARVPEASGQTAATRLRVDADARAVGSARRFVAATLRDWQVGGQVVDDAVLLASELVTNALLHGRPPIELRLRRGATALVAEVCDGATYLPRRLRPSPEDEHGRGLQLVDVLADRWGARPTSEGKAVWCSLDLAAGGRRPVPAP